MRSLKSLILCASVKPLLLCTYVICAEPPPKVIVLNTKIIIFNTKIIVFNTKFITFNTKFLIFHQPSAGVLHPAAHVAATAHNSKIRYGSAKFTIFNTKFLVFNTKYFVFHTNLSFSLTATPASVSAASSQPAEKQEKKRTNEAALLARAWRRIWAIKTRRPLMVVPARRLRFRMSLLATAQVLSCANHL